MRALMPINAAGELLGYLAVTANRKNGDLRTETALTIMLPTLAEAVSLQHTHESDLDSRSREIAQRYEELTMVDQIAEALAVKNSRDNGIARLFGALLDSMRCDAVALTVPSQNVCASHPPELLSAESAPVLVESFRTCIEPSLPVAVMNHVFAVPSRAMPERVAHAPALFLDGDGDEGALLLFRKSNSDRYMAGDIV